MLKDHGMTDVLTEGESPGNPRSRPIVSCLNCRRKKQKCDRRLPCNSCVRSGRPSSCQYAPGQEPVLDDSDEASQNNKRRRTDLGDGSEDTLQVPVASFIELQERVGQLERALQTQTQQIQVLINDSANVHQSPKGTENSGPQLRSRKKTSELCLYKPLRGQVCSVEQSRGVVLTKPVFRPTSVH